VLAMGLDHFIGVDVGTGSVRAGLVVGAGKMVATATKDIGIRSPRPNFYQQSSVEIWEAVIHTVKVGS